MIRVGTSGFAYAEWKPDFYPQDLSPKKFLQFYASRLPAVEIDSTFYRMPSAKTLESWVAATGAEFRFALKASRKITHFERLGVPSESLDYFQDILGRLGPRLGMVLYQLPPNFRMDIDRLALFLSGLDRNIPAAFEFRHESWFTPEVYSLLSDYGAVLAIHESDEAITPMELTAPRTYVRLRKSSYSPEDRVRWIAEWKKWESHGIDVYAFVKHKDNPDAPGIVQAFIDGLGELG